MPKLTLQNFGLKLVEKRGATGVRETAKKIGVSPATLSRVERGYLPDINTFKKICKWYKIDPSEVLEFKAVKSSKTRIAVNFRKDQAIKLETAEALAQMILAAQRAFIASEE